MESFGLRIIQHYENEGPHLYGYIKLVSSYLRQSFPSSQNSINFKIFVKLDVEYAPFQMTGDN